MIDGTSSEGIAGEDKKQGSESSQRRSPALGAANDEEVLNCRTDWERNTKIPACRRTNRVQILTSSHRRPGIAASGELGGGAEGGPGRERRTRRVSLRRGMVSAGGNLIHSASAYKRDALKYCRTR